MARVIDLRDGRPSGTRHWLKVAAWAGVASALGIGVASWIARAPERPELPLPSAAVAVQRPGVAVVEPTMDAAARTPPASEPLASCAAPLQTLQLTFATDAPLSVCAGRTQVRQNGSVRTFVAQDGGRAWTLQVDTAGGSVLKVSLRSRDGRRFACEGQECLGIRLITHDALGIRTIELRETRLTLADAPAARGPTSAVSSATQEARVKADLALVSSDPLPGLACTGPSLTISAPDGVRQNFCAQGGTGFEIADDGSRIYQFQDFEGRTLAVRLSPQQAVMRVSFGRHACDGAACRGVTVSAAQPDNELAERSFFFGRTDLTEGGASSGSVGASPGLQLNGSLVLQGQS